MFVRGQRQIRVILCAPNAERAVGIESCSADEGRRVHYPDTTIGQKSDCMALKDGYLVRSNKVSSMKLLCKKHKCCIHKVALRNM